MKHSLLFSLLLLLSASLAAQTTWDNFQDSRKGTYGFISGVFIPYFENPDPTGANTSLVVAEYTRNSVDQFDVILLDAPMEDVTDYRTGAKSITMDVWSPNVGTTVQVTVENSVLAQPTNYPTGRHSEYTATTTVANAWETLTFNFVQQPDPSVLDTNVDRIVILFAPGTNTGDTYYWDNFNAPEIANDPCVDAEPDPAVLNDFECNQSVDFIFSHSGVNFQRIDNPDASGVNTSSNVAQYIRNSAEEFDVLIGRFDGNLSLGADNTISLDVWDPDAPTDVVLSLQNINGDVIIEMTQTTSSSSAWETLTFDPTSVSEAPDIAQFVILFDPGNFTSDQYFFDNFQLNGTVNTEDITEINRFEAFPNPSSGQAITFQYDLKEAADLDLSIFDLTGRQVTRLVDAEQGTGTHTARWSTQGVSAGIYFYTLVVNGKTASGKLVVTQ